MDNLRELLGLRRRVSSVNVVTCVQRPTSDCAKVPAEEKKEGPKPSKRRVTPEGWAVGVPYSATTARTRQRNGAVPQRLYAAPSSRPRSHVPTHCSRTLAGSPARPWVAGSPVAFLVATPWWPPDRCAAGLDFLWGAEAREGRHLGALKVVFCPQQQAWTRPSSSAWGD